MGQESLEIFRRIRETIVRRAQVWANLRGEWIHFSPHALGWPGDEASVQALAPQERREDVIEGGTWQWLPNWQWVRRADLEIPMVRRGEWITCPPEQRSDLDFLSWQIAWRRDLLPEQGVGFARTDLAGQLREGAGQRARP